jgi:hypothetical protein
MPKPETLVVDGHGFNWQRLCEIRRRQLEAWRVAQPATLCASFPFRDKPSLSFQSPQGAASNIVGIGPERARRSIGRSLPRLRLAPACAASRRQGDEALTAALVRSGAIDPTKPRIPCGSQLKKRKTS